MILRKGVFRPMACWIVTGLFPILALGGMPAQEAASGPSLSARLVPIPGPGPWTVPMPSPDGRWLAFTKGDCEGIYLFEFESGKTIQLNDEPGAGYRFAWSPDSSGLAYRKRMGPSRLAIVFAHTSGVEESVSALLPSLSTPFFEGSELVFFRFEEGRPVKMRRGPGEKAGHSSVPVASPEGRLWLEDERGILREQAKDARVFYNLLLSPGGVRFVVECLDGHLYAGNTGANELKDLGAGSYPSFVHGGRSLLFERTADDGHRLTGGDLYLLDLDSGDVSALTQTSDRIERRPALASDGSTVYFEESGGLYEGRLP
jgi:Tol biopolymer transport system component